MSACGGSISSTMICGGFHIVSCIPAIWILWMFFWYVCCSSSISLMSIIREILCSKIQAFYPPLIVIVAAPKSNIEFLAIKSPSCSWIHYHGPNMDGSFVICFVNFLVHPKSQYPYSCLLNPTSLENKKIFNQSILTWFCHNSLLTLLISRDKEFPISHSLLSLFSNI